MKKIIILLALLCLCACSSNASNVTTNTTDELSLNEAFVTRWNEAVSKERVVILTSANLGNGERLLVKMLDDATIDAEASKCEDATYAEVVKEAAKTFVSEVASVMETIELTKLEATTRLSTFNTFKFELSNPELALDPEVISLIFYDDMHVKAKYNGVEELYSVDETTYNTLASIVEVYADVIAAQNAQACSVQYFAK